MKITVKRSKWGTGPAGGSLRNAESGLRCCLGFAMEQVGCATSHITGAGMPADCLWNYSDRRREEKEKVLVKKGLLKEKTTEWGCVVSENSDFCIQAAGINDDEDITDTEREKQLKELAKKHGHTMRFID